MNRSEAMEKAFATIVKRVNQAIATDDSQFLTGALLHIRDVAKAAVAMPKRNCDVGTAEEQEKRWYRICGHGIPNCKHCKVYGKAKESGLVDDRGFLRCSCEFIWAQMPYEEGGAK